MNRKVFLSRLIKNASFLFSFLFFFSSPSFSLTVSLTKIVDHPSLDAIEQGIKEVIQQSNLAQQTPIKIESISAQGSPVLAVQIAQKFVGQNPDVMVPISTPSAQTMLVADKAVKIPIVFAAVSDPKQAQLVTAKGQLPYVTGVCDHPPLKEQIDLIQQLYPDHHHIGVLYNPGEVHSVRSVELLRELLKATDLRIHANTVNNSKDIYQAAQSLVAKGTTLFLVLLDNTVASGLESLVRVAKQNHIPIVATDPDSVRRGADIALAYDQKAIGQQVGAMVIKVLSGVCPNAIPIEKPKELKIYTGKALPLPKTILFPVQIVRSR